MASATPDLLLPSQPYQFILLGEQKHIVCEQLAQSRYVKRSGRDSNLRPLSCKSDTLSTTPPRHTFTKGGLKFKNLYPEPWPRPSLLVFCHPWDGTIPVQNLKCLAHSFQRCGSSRMQFLDEQVGVPKLMHKFPSFLSDLHKIWLNIVEWSMLNANVLDFRYVISNIMYTSILASATHYTTG